MKTKLEEIAAKALKETNLVFTSIAHHVTKEMIWDSLSHIPNNSSSGTDGTDVETAKKDFNLWSEEMLKSVEPLEEDDQHNPRLDACYKRSNKVRLRKIRIARL